MRKIKVDALLLKNRILLGMAEDLHQCQQCCQPHFMVFTADALLQILKACFLPAFFHYGARYGDFDTKELVSLAVLARACLEEARKSIHLRWIGL